MRIKTPSLKFWLLLGLALLLAGCSAAPAKPKLRVFWPPLPADPYLEWKGTYASQDSFEKTKREQMMQDFIGKPELYTFRKPTGIAGDSERGLVFVADGDHKNIRVFDFNQRTVEFLSKEPLGQFPTGLALDSRDNLYMCDAGTGRVKILSPAGVPVKEFGAGLIKKAAHVAINERLGRIYVSDSLGHQIHVFDMTGEHLFTFGKKGQNETNLYVPQGLAIDDQDRVFVADQLNARIQIFDADGNHVGRFGKRGDRAWNFEAPRGLAFDPDGNLWVTDARKGAFMIYDTEGQLLLNFTAGKDMNHPLSLGYPNAISIDANGRVYITDLAYLRFQVWQYFTAVQRAKGALSEAEKQKQLEILRQSRPGKQQP